MPFYPHSRLTMPLLSLLKWKCVCTKIKQTNENGRKAKVNKTPKSFIHGCGIVIISLPVKPGPLKSGRNLNVFL